MPLPINGKSPRSVVVLVLILTVGLVTAHCAKGNVVEGDADTVDSGDAGGDADADGDRDSDGDDETLMCTQDDAEEVCGTSPCVDGYCCDDPCVEACRACNLDGTEGRCRPIEAGIDPEGECEETPPGSCGSTGACNGGGECALYGPETSCDDGEACSADDACDGSGSCVGIMPEGCEPGPGNQCCEPVCSDGSCFTVDGVCAERCSTHQLITGLTCVGCGAAGAEGICTGGLATSCNDSSHTLCEQADCDGVTYYCTNVGGEWEWRTGVACDDGEVCSFGDACLDEECTSTAYSCESEPCMERICDGEGDCLETALEATESCGTTPCSVDVCVDDVWSHYPEECTAHCDGEGSCTTCTCESLDTTCGVGDGNECCVAECADATGCYTVPGTCGAADVCGSNVLDIASACEGCGDAGAAGTCGGALLLECNATSHTLCLAATCGGVTYYCTDFGGSWQWRAGDPRCDDGDDCTYSDACGGGSCVGTTINCDDTQCMTRSCNGTEACTEVPLTGTQCNDGDLCTHGETCDASGSCPAGTAIVCLDTDCVDRECDGTANCAETILTGATCSDGNACSYGETCDAAGSCTSGTTIDCDSSDWTCMDFSCNGTSTCTQTPNNLGGACDDGDPLTDDDQCRADGSCAGDAGCPPPSDSCDNGTQDRRDCDGARVIGRTVAGSGGGFVIESDTCSAWDEFDDSSGCWDANSDHTYRLYMREGESVYVRYETFDPCPWSEGWSWYGTLKIFENSGCDDLACTTKVYCDYNETNQNTTYVAPRDGWIIIVADGSSAFDDDGDYELTVQLTCNEPGCEC